MGMKEFMYKPTYTGMTAGGTFEGPPRALFAGGIPVVELAPAFELKTVDDATIVITSSCGMQRSTRGYTPSTRSVRSELS